MQLKLLSAAILGTSLLTACGGGSSSDSAVINVANVQKVVNTNAAIAYAVYSDAVDTAIALQTALETFRENPTQANLDAARKAWLVAREPYGQSEVYRFRNSPIDSTDYSSEDGPEGMINAWPLGEALIDYVVAGDDFGTDQVGVTANSAGLNGGGSVDADEPNIINTTSIEINTDLLAGSASAEDEHDVIAGYHAIEFLLWGQDLNNDGAVTKGDDRENAVKTFTAGDAIATGGQRPVSDFVPGYGAAEASESVNIEYDETNLANRRHKYLEVAVQQLIDDLTAVRDGWAPGAPYRTAFTTVTNESQAKQKLSEILTGMGTLSEGELAGERMQISFSANSQEDEHSCFSDNTHRDIWLDAEGVANSYYGEYAGYDSTLDGNDNATTRAVSGYGIDDYLADAGLTSLASRLNTALQTTKTGYTAIDTKARAGQPVDVLIMDANRNNLNPMYATIVGLNAQAGIIAEVATALGIDGVVDEDASACDTSNPEATCD